MTYESNQQTAVIAVSQEDVTIIGDWRQGLLRLHVDDLESAPFVVEHCPSLFGAVKVTSRTCRDVLRELKAEAKESAEN